jgi:hypothetical protein
MIEPIASLSERGRRRREEILQIAIGAARARRWRRRSGAGIVIAMLLATATAIVLPRVQSRVPIVHEDQGIRKSSVPSNEIVIVQILDDPHVVERLSIPDPGVSIQRIGDEQLLDELAAAHEPAGLAYVNGKAVLMYR